MATPDAGYRSRMPFFFSVSARSVGILVAIAFVVGIVLGVVIGRAVG